MNIRAIETRGSDAPNRQAELTIGEYVEISGFYAYYAPNFCGCGCGEGDCHSLVGHGDTAELAAEDYWSQWGAKHEPTN